MCQPEDPRRDRRAKDKTHNSGTRERSRRAASAVPATVESSQCKRRQARLPRLNEKDEPWTGEAETERAAKATATRVLTNMLDEGFRRRCSEMRVGEGEGESWKEREGRGPRDVRWPGRRKSGRRPGCGRVSARSLSTAVPLKIPRHSRNFLTGEVTVPR